MTSQMATAFLFQVKTHTAEVALDVALVGQRFSCDRRYGPG